MSKGHWGIPTENRGGTSDAIAIYREESREEGKEVAEKSGTKDKGFQREFQGDRVKTGNEGFWMLRVKSAGTACGKMGIK